MPFPPTSSSRWLSKQNVFGAICIAGVAAYFMFRSTIPTYEGLTAREWILNFRADPNKSEAMLALIGDEALPLIESMLYTAESGGGAKGNLPGWLGGGAAAEESESKLAAMACCALAGKQEALIPMAIERMASDEGIKSLEQFRAVSGANLGGIAGSSDYNPGNWRKQGDVFHTSDFLTVFFALAGEEALLALARQASAESGLRQSRLLLSFAHSLRVLGAYPQNNEWYANGLPWTAPPFRETSEWEVVAAGWLPLADSGDTEVRSAVIYSLAVMDGAGVNIDGARNAIMACAQDPKPSVRAWFSRAAGNLTKHDEHDLPPVASLTANLDVPLDIDTAEALKSLPFDAKPAFSDVQPMLGHSITGVRLEAIRALGSCDANHKVALPLLLAKLGGRDEQEWRAARSGLRKRAEDGRRETLNALREAIRGDNQALRARAAQTLAIIDKKSRTTQIFVIRSLGDASVLYEEDPRVVREALAAFAALESGAANDGLPLLLRFIKLTKSDANKGWAAITLASVGYKKPETIIPALTELLSAGDPETVAGAITALGRLGKHATPLIPLLEKLLEDKRTFELRAISWKPGAETIKARAAMALSAIRRAE